jgi:hypothetical protein
MRSRYLLVLLGGLCCCMAHWALGQAPATPPPETSWQEGHTYVAIVRQPTGQRAIEIDYPWKAHRRPSVEVRLVTAQAKDPASVRPLFFVKDFLKRSLAMDVYRCQDEAANGIVSKSVTHEGMKLEILGQRNSVGKASVCVAWRLAADDPAPGTAAAFYPLPSWSMNKRVLYLDLPRDYFAEAGKLHVWFLREGRIVWSETIDWPGWESVPK